MLLETGAAHGTQGYPPEFRRRAVELVEAGRSVADVAHDLDVSGQSIYQWRRQIRIEDGDEGGVTSAERAELSAANRRIAQLEKELAIAMKAVEHLKEVADPKAGTRRSN